MEPWIWLAIVVAALVGVDRLLLWMEGRGWLRYRRRRPNWAAGRRHLLDIQALYDPGVRHTIEFEIEEERADEDDAGDPPLSFDDPPSTSGTGSTKNS